MRYLVIIMEISSVFFSMFSAVSSFTASGFLPQPVRTATVSNAAAPIRIFLFFPFRFMHMLPPFPSSVPRPLKLSLASAMGGTGRRFVGGTASGAALFLFLHPINLVV